MNAITNLAPIGPAVLDEHWFTLRLRTWKAVRKVVRESAVDQKKLAERIDMDPGQFNKVITGKKSNVTLRTLHNIARAANHRLKITLEPLADLPKPNYTYEDARRERETKTDAPLMEKWSLERGGASGSGRMVVTAG